MQKSYYFSHDFGARNDPKLQSVWMKFGIEGIGLFWCVVEMMYEEGGKLEIDKCESYAFALRTDKTALLQLINACFESDDTYFWSESVLRRIQMMQDKSQKARNSANQRWNANALRTQSDGNAIKEKKRKEKKSESEYIFDEYGNRSEKRKAGAGTGMRSLKELLQEKIGPIGSQIPIAT